MSSVTLPSKIEGKGEGYVQDVDRVITKGVSQPVRGWDEDSVTARHAKGTS
jgi:hypothetical protein